MAHPPSIGALTVTSPDLSPEAPVPEVFTGYREDRVPRIRVSGVPAGAVELALVCHDPDAPLARGFTHWTVYGIPPEDGVEVGPDASDRFRVGPNGLGQHAWTGPRPPAGHGLHHYFFWVYALTRPVEGAPSREEFLARYADDILEQGRLVVTAARSQEA